MAIIEVTALSKYYGKYMSIEQVSFSVEKGEIFGIVGAEDAGKTTVLDILAGAVKPSSGKCVVCGLDVQGNAQQVARMLRVVSQNGETYSRLRAKTVDKYLKGIAQEGARTRAQRWCAYFGIAETEVIRKMSKQKKTALYMIDVLLGMPRILMLDNPFDGADQEFIGRMSQFLANENKRGLTVIVTAREEAQIAHLCTRMVHMVDGHMLTDGAQAAAQMQDEVNAVEPAAPQMPQQAPYQEPYQEDYSEYAAPQEPAAPDLGQGNGYARGQEAFASEMPGESSQSDEMEFAQMRRDFYAQNTIRQSTVRPQRRGANHQEMFRQLEEDFFQTQDVQVGADSRRASQEMNDAYFEPEQPRRGEMDNMPMESYRSDFDHTRRFSMSPDEYRTAQYQDREQMSQTRAYPRFDQNYSRGFDHAERFTQQNSYQAHGRFESAQADYSAQDAEIGYAAYSEQTQSTGSYSMPAFAQQERWRDGMYEETEPASSARAYSSDSRVYALHAKQARASYTAYEREDVAPDYARAARRDAQQGRHAYVPRREYEQPIRGAHVKREVQPFAYEMPHAYTSYSSAPSHAQERRTSYEEKPSYSHSAAYGAHTRSEGMHSTSAGTSYDDAFEGRHVRGSHAARERAYDFEDTASRRYSASSQGTHARPASHAQSTAKEADHSAYSDYTLYSSHHNASVHMPSDQGNRRITLEADNVPIDFLRNIGATGVHQQGDRVEFFFNGQMDRLIVALSQMNVRDLRVSMDVPVSGFEQE